jgi:TolB-like protein
VRVVALSLVVALPVVVLLAWYHGHKAQHRISTGELSLLTVLLLIAGTAMWGFTRARAPVAPAAVEPAASVAVIPFANLTGDPSKDYFSDGMAEELINLLAQVPGLKVPARTSSFAYKGRNTDIRRIARDLGVATILEGSVRSAGERIRVTAQLVNARTGYHEWSRDYDRQFTDIFKLQDELAAAIVQALRSTMGATISATQSVSRAPSTTDVEAYNLTLQGLALTQEQDAPAEQIASAIGLFQQAISRDPHYARAWSGIAWAYLGRGIVGHSAADVAEAERAANRALAINPSEGPAHTALGTIDFFRDLVAGEGHWRSALAGAPNDPFSHSLYVFQLLIVGHLRGALEEARKAYALAPASSFALDRMARAYSSLGNDTEALRFADRAIELGQPKDGYIQAVYASAAVRAKHYAQAVDFFAGPLEASGSVADARAAAAVRKIFAALTDPAQRPAALALRQELQFDATPVQSMAGVALANDSCTGVSYGYVLLGALDDAYAVTTQCRLLPGRIPGMVWAPEMQAFRRDTRFGSLLGQIEGQMGSSLLRYWQQYGPPDDCDLHGDMLVCR